MTTTLFHFGVIRVLRWGNGFGVRIPVALARRTGIADGTMVDVFREGSRVIIEPQPVLPTLEQLLAGVTQSRIPEEAEWRRPAYSVRGEAL